MKVKHAKEGNNKQNKHFWENENLTALYSSSTVYLQVRSSCEPSKTNYVQVCLSNYYYDQLRFVYFERTGHKQSGYGANAGGEVAAFDQW